MWLFTVDGFYSAVSDSSDPSVVWVRARVKEDLERLISRYSVSTHGILANRGTDYTYRIAVWRDEWMRIVSNVAVDVDYTNFKDEVKHRLGEKRAQGLFGVWWEMLKLQVNSLATWSEGPQNHP